MQGPPRVSVVIPAYQHARFIAEAIASAQTQSLDDIEIVVVDDGSSDDTGSIARAMAVADSRIRVFDQANGGSHAAIERGIAESRGEWIAILNSDDRFHRTRLATMLAACGDNHDFALSDARLIDTDGDPVVDPGHWWLRAHGACRAQVRARGAIDGLLYGNYAVSTSNFLMRRSLREAIGPFRPLRHILDWDFAIRAALHAPARFLYLQDQTLFDYRIHGGNAILRNAARGALEISRMHRRLLRSHPAIAPALVPALFRAQRDLRRYGRAGGAAQSAQALAAAARTLDDLDRETRRLSDALAEAQRFTRSREQEIADLTDALRTAQRIALEREADRLSLETELHAIRSTLLWRVLHQIGLTGPTR